MQLGAAGATVYVTGRTTRAHRSEMNRPETIEETAELVDKAGGCGIAVGSTMVPEEVRELVQRIEAEQAALHILVNDIWGATKMEWGRTVWESDLDYGLRTLRLGVDTHAITSHFALPLLIRQSGGLVVEVTDGTAEYNAETYRVSFFYDLAKAAVLRMAFALAHELEKHRATAVALTPGWLRSEHMLEAYGVTEANWQDATSRSRTSRSRKAPPSSAGRWRRSRRTRTCHAGTGGRCRAASSRRSTASRTWTAASPTPGSTSSKFRTPANRLTSAAIASVP